MLLIPLIIGLLAIFLSLIFSISISRGKVHNEKLTEVATFVKNGANSYLTRQIKTILLVTPFLFVIILIILGPREAISAVLGVLTSLLASFIGMSVCVRANLKTADAALSSTIKSFRKAVLGGAVTGLCITGFSLVVLSILYFFFKSFQPLIGFGFGASLAALFAQIGGGIFTKSADIGADLVGKIEEKIPEDDPRNPAVIADLVGDNVGDCAGRGSDLFQTFSDDIITGSIVASTFIPRYGPNVLFFPIVLISVGVLSSSVGILITRILKNKTNPLEMFNIGLIVTAILCFIFSFFVTKIILNDFNLWISGILGILTTLVAAITTHYYAGVEGAPVKKIAEASKRGPALNLITALGFGLQSPIASIIMIISSIILAFNFSGGSILAIVILNIGTDLLIGFIMAADAFGPIVDNAAGLAEMSNAPEEVTKSLSLLDSVGNTMKATTKSYAMSSGTVTAFVIFATYFTLTKISSFDLTDPKFVGFLFVGICLPFLISSLVIKSTAKTAELIVDEVRRQFREIVGLIEGKALPDYSLCVDIATKNALKEMILPGIISILVPVLIGLVFGATALGCLLIGAIASAALLAPFFSNTGTALDNAKKIIENTESKDSFAYSAAVVGDTVGDPLKDVAGPSLLIFMKLIGMTALLIAPLLH